MADVEILRTGKLYEADMLAAALTENRVPHYRRMANFAGVELAMPAMATPGLGTFFTVIVPDAAAEDARRVLSELPIVEENPGLWSFAPRPWARKLITVYAAITLAIFIIGTLASLVHK